MAQTQKRAAPRQRTALSHNIPMQLASYAMEDTAPDPSRQGAPAAWIARRFGLPPSTAALVVELAGIGGGA